jgi:hypothetical protein
LAEFAASVTVTPNVPLPALGGVPETVPPAKFSHDDPLKLNAYGGLPPVTDIGTDTGTPACADAGQVPPIDNGGGAIFIVQGPAVAVKPPLATCIVNIEAAGGPCGVPAMLLPANESPGGNDPFTIENR